MTPIDAPEGTVWLFVPRPGYVLDKEIIFVVLGASRRNFYREYVDLETGHKGELLKDSRLHKESKRIL